MASKTHKTAVVVIPPAEVWPPIQAIRRKHDRQVRRWMPHVTLLYPFRPAAEFDAVSAELARVGAGLRAFEMELATFHLFAHSRRRATIWLAPEPGDAVRDLQTRLWQAVPDCDELRRFADGFTPHLSVGQARGTEEARRLIDRWQSTWVPLRFQVTAMALIRRDKPPNDVFRVAKTIPLGDRDQP